MRTGEYPDDWEDRRKQVLERDEYECQRCGAADETLHVHHITPISEGGSHDLSNLEALCESCHAQEHPVQIKLRTANSENKRIRMKYHSYSGTRVREVDPYGIEMHEGIQYMVGHDYYRDEIRYFRPTRIEWIEVLDEGFSPPTDFDAKTYLSRNLQSRKAESGCFIATAAYGTPHAEDIDRLRNFRDNVLREYLLGTLFIRTYYRVSPPIAEWISRKKWRQKLVLKIIIRPVLRIFIFLCSVSVIFCY